ncbi:antitoxin Xre/MbcA/ParS toxin-binding domain-containing protein [Pseudomonas sp. NyZ704]|nr:antitoxin Xre/MbcA/ParS toxin-binding domain-containing protein [Pseudomonas sp. NyZ704]
MNIRDGLPASRLAEFESTVRLNVLELRSTDALPTNSLTAEILALTLLAFGSPDAARHYLHKPSSRLAGTTPLARIKDSEASCEMVIEDLFRIIEGYVF